MTPTHSVAPATRSSPTQAVAHRAGTSAYRRPHHHRAVPKKHKADGAQAARRRNADAVRPLSALFASSLRLALHAPGPAPAAGAGPQDGPGDALVLASLALLMLVITGLMVLRTSAQVLRRERPA